ncbi:MAG: hypothetical protein GZ094_16005 [Mariniphaga sp.]|nr:hypothetical protein [Mariniphaga sp.]
MANETESWMNSNGEVAEIALQLAAYNAQEYVNAELAAEIKNRMDNATNDFESEKAFNNSNELANN